MENQNSQIRIIIMIYIYSTYLFSKLNLINCKCGLCNLLINYKRKFINFLCKAAMVEPLNINSKETFQLLFHMIKCVRNLYIFCIKINLFLYSLHFCNKDKSGSMYSAYIHSLTMWHAVIVWQTLSFCLVFECLVIMIILFWVEIILTIVNGK